jgi:hydrogenase nickel incorporation protein HypB
VLPYFDFDAEKVVEYAKLRNPDIQVFFVSAKTGEGIKELSEYLIEKMNEWIS